MSRTRKVKPLSQKDLVTVRVLGKELYHLGGPFCSYKVGDDHPHLTGMQSVYICTRPSHKGEPLHIAHSAQGELLSAWTSDTYAYLVEKE